MDTVKESIQALRRQRLERSGAFPIHSFDQALRFLDDVGFCCFSHHEDVELPCFSDSLAPEVASEAWGWKDSLPNTRLVYYGTIFRFHASDAVRPGFLALRILEACYALSPVMQFDGDRSMLPRWTGLRREALSLADTLERDGSLSTKDLRRAAALAGKEHATRFSQALIEAQQNFLIVRTGITSTSRGNYSYIWESFPRAYPRVVEAAGKMTEMDAASAVLRQYVDSAVAVTEDRVASVLSLHLPLLRRATAAMVEAGALRRDAEGCLRLPNRPG